MVLRNSVRFFRLDLERIDFAMIALCRRSVVAVVAQRVGGSLVMVMAGRVDDSVYCYYDGFIVLWTALDFGVDG